MRKNRSATFRTFWLGLVLLCSSHPLRADQFGLFAYQIVGGATVEITDYPDAAVGPVEIPAVIAGKPVTSIGDFAFSNCSGFASVTIPSSVTSIGGYAFSGCLLTSVNIPSSVSSIDGNGFSYCSSLTSITIPSSVTSIGGGAFYRCTGLTSIAIPSNVTGLGSYISEEFVGPFFGCSGLTSVTIPSSVTTIGNWAFGECSGLTG